MRSLFLFVLGSASLTAGLAPAQPYQPQAYPERQYPSQPYQPQPSGGSEAPPPPQIVTPDKANNANVQNAAEGPLHDLNLVRQKIPPVLLAALADPYARPRVFSCPGLVAEIAGLEQALGGDFDEPDNPQNPSLTTRRGVALSIVHGASELLLPFAGFVRTLTGAQKHDELVIEAITAGSVRRGYLKGLGEAYRCRPPAAPIHGPRPPAPYREHRQPLYPDH